MAENTNGSINQNLRAAREERRKQREQQQQSNPSHSPTEPKPNPTEQPKPEPTADQQSADGINRRKPTKPKSDNEAVMAGLGEIAQPGQRKRRAPNKKTVDPDTVKLVAGLFGTIFGMTAIRAGAHWSITEHEAHQLAQPTVAVMNKYGLLDKLTKHSDLLALGLALSAIVAPRTMVTYSHWKQNKTMRRGVQKHVPIRQTEQPNNGRADKPEERKIASSQHENVGVPAADVQTDSEFYTGSALA